MGGYFDNNLQGAAWVYTRSGGVWRQQGSKLVGTGGVLEPTQGTSVSLSSDGNTAIVGGYTDDSNQGAVWFFTRSGGVWSQQGNKLVGTGNVGTAQQGISVKLSADGNTAIVGGNSDDNGQGAAWIYTRSGGVWSQQGSKLVDTGGVVGSNKQQGSSVSLSADGNTAIVGGNGDNSNQGAIWVYTRSGGGVWSQHGGKMICVLGTIGSLSADGNTAIVCGSDSGQGAVWVFNGALPNNANLSSLSISSGSLLPIFTASTLSYAISVNNNNSSLFLTPVKSDSNAICQVRVNNGAYTTVNTNNSSLSLPLNVGTNMIDVKVIAQDGITIKIYTIAITRAAAILNIQLNITAFLQGLYLGGGTMVSAPFRADGVSPTNIADTITIQLYESIGSNNLAYSSIGLLNTSGNALLNFPSTANGNSYYIVVKHRNSIETWSATPVAITSSGATYNFSDAANKAFGDNLSNMGNGVFAIYSGDINQDGSVDFNDYPSLDIASNDGILGYDANDLNGDASVDFNDYPILDVNSSNGVLSLKP
ncbi:MAG: cadherin-like beta sandwich domain-containing protein [Bacteroidetes bacterium]|nr:cadherin-like beta sandwich domain-containing protein [Bacteroidota bacterium]